MPEERTVSVFTRMNTATRDAQEVWTLVDMTQIRQFNMYQSKVIFSHNWCTWELKWLQDTLDYEHPTVKFCDIDQAIFGKAQTKDAKRVLEKSTLVVDEADENEAIVDDHTSQWMDSPLHVNGEGNFGSVEEDANLDAPELDEILADGPRARKGKENEVDTATASEDDGEDVDSRCPLGVGLT